MPRWLNAKFFAAGRFGLQIQNKLRERPRAEIAFALVAHRDGARLRFLSADDQHVGNFLHLRVANFGLQFFVAIVEVRAEPGVLQRGRQLSSRTR